MNSCALTSLLAILASGNITEITPIYLLAMGMVWKGTGIYEVYTLASFIDFHFIRYRFQAQRVSLTGNNLVAGMEWKAAASTGGIQSDVGQAHRFQCSRLGQ